MRRMGSPDHELQEDERTHKGHEQHRYPQEEEGVGGAIGGLPVGLAAGQVDGLEVAGDDEARHVDHSEKRDEGA